MGTKQITMKLMGEPEGGGVITGKQAPVLKGAGMTDYLCGGCMTVVAASMREGEIDGTTFRCPKCQCVNRVP